MPAPAAPGARTSWSRPYSVPVSPPTAASEPSRVRLRRLRCSLAATSSADSRAAVAAAASRWSPSPSTRASPAPL
eukprot:scaffold257349_cov36-Tisochrysis_lutea.AAC.1